MMEDLLGVRTETEVSGADNSVSVAETQFEPYYSLLKVVHNVLRDGLHFLFSFPFPFLFLLHLQGPFATIQ